MLGARAKDLYSKFEENTAAKVKASLPTLQFLSRMYGGDKILMKEAEDKGEFYRCKVDGVEHCATSSTTVTNTHGSRHGLSLKGTKKASKQAAELARQAIKMFKWDIPEVPSGSCGSVGAFPYATELSSA